MKDVTSEWSRLRSEPALDPQSWDLDDITVEPGALILHDSTNGTWRIAGFPEPQDAVAFMLTGDHRPQAHLDPPRHVAPPITNCHRIS